MSDFTDDEDRQLVQWALMFTRNDQQILWEKLTQLMKGTKKSKEALRQRLKTLKRTHGRRLEQFPAWYFKKVFVTQVNPQRLRTSRRTSAKLKSIRESDKRVNKSRCKPRRRTVSEPEAFRSPAKTSTKLEKMSPTLKTPPQCSKCMPAMKTEPLPSLLLLASVASTSHGQGVMDSTDARV